MVSQHANFKTQTFYPNFAAAADITDVSKTHDFVEFFKILALYGRQMTILSVLGFQDGVYRLNCVIVALQQFSGGK